MIKIYNTLTKKKERLNYNNLIKLYTCGITVHDFCHIGHAKIFVFFDTMIRYLNALSINIIYIRNITDIDDKIINKSIKNKQSLNYITGKFIKSMHQDTKNLHIAEPSFEPKATIFINNIINLIYKLKLKFYAYEAKNNDVYYDTKYFQNYGQLSNRKLERTHIVNHEYKKHKEDFSLWKNVKKFENIFWSTSFGNGRPGWHTECAAMSLYYGNNNIDIHGGGEDLVFPHHENELAQCEAITNSRFVKLWMHVGHLNIKKEKMSKTKKNYILIRDLLKNFDFEVIRFFFLLTHYRGKTNFSNKNLTKAKQALSKLYKSLLLYKNIDVNLDKNIIAKFLDALNDDFNTPKAISVLFNYIKNEKNIKNNQCLLSTIKYLGNLIGILHAEPSKFLNKKEFCKNDLDKIYDLKKKRDKARKEKNWVLADKIRTKLIKMNVQVNDETSINV